jgi:GrpB-like predicted nucleotidyltransferase (UPF0157 family)
MTSPRPVVVAFRPEWAGKADSLIAELGEALGECASRIEHIGSTAIPSMPAKDVVDLQVSVADLGQAADTFEEPLQQRGFHRTPYERDHVPAGRGDDPDDWAKLLWVRRDPPDGDVNLHVRRIGSPNERLALLFRDWFRSHPDAIPAYGRFKTSLAEIAGGIDVYTDVKDPVVDLVGVVAESWAAASGWQVAGPPAPGLS